MARWLVGIIVIFCPVWVMGRTIPPSDAVDGAEVERRLPILVHPVKADLPLEERKKLDKALEDALFSYTGLEVYTFQEFRNQIGWKRQQKQIQCQFPEDCLRLLKEDMELRHEVTFAIAPLVDGRLNLRLNLIVGEEGREFVETIPELAAAPVVLGRIVPDLIGLPSGVRHAEGVVHVSSFPMGAKVYADGALSCSTPCSIVADGGAELRLKAEREGRPPFSATVRIKRGQVIRWFADLVTRQGSILVDSTPPGATIELDGREAGVTPQVIRNVLTGEHDVRLTMPPYPEMTYRITVGADEVARIRHGFLPENGRLEISAANREKSRTVEIYLDGLRVADNLYVAEIQPAEYRVHIVQDGYETHEEKVSLESGKTVIIKPTMKTGLALRPGQEIGREPDYRPGAFTLATGVVAVAFGTYLELEAQGEYDSAKKAESSSDKKEYERTGLISRSLGGVLMGLGSAVVITGVVLLILPPEMDVAVTPAVDPVSKQAAVSVKISY